MARPVSLPPNLQDAIRAYKAGETIQKCAAMCGIAHTTFRKHLIRLEVPLRDRTFAAQARKITLPAGLITDFKKGASVYSLSRKYGLSVNTIHRRLSEDGHDTSRRLIPTPDGLLEDYLGGMSVKAVARKYGIERGPVYRMLGEAHIDGRDRSEAMQVRWQRATVAERRAMLNPAHEATRGRVVPAGERGRIARAKDGRTLSVNETTLGAILTDLGYDIAYGVACGPYNLDIVIAGTVAVEIFGGQWHEVGQHRARFGERSRHIFDSGYSLAIIWAQDPRYSPGVRCAQHLGTLTEITRSHPAIGRQHWVIRGDGYFLAIREDHGNEVPFITAAGGCDR